MVMAQLLEWFAPDLSHLESYGHRNSERHFVGTSGYAASPPHSEKPPWQGVLVGLSLRTAAFRVSGRRLWGQPGVTAAASA